MYKVISRKTKDIKYLIADSDDDVLKIIDYCGPGSIVEVLNGKGGEEDSPKETHKFIMGPNMRWALYEGESELEIPKNDIKVIIPDYDAEASDGKKVIDYQENITIYPTGLVTGISKKNTSSLFGTGDDAEGHFLLFNVDVPEGATKMKLTGSSGEAKEITPPDPQIMIKVDKFFQLGNESKKLKVEFEGDSSSQLGSYEFDVRGLTLE